MKIKFLVVKKIIGNFLEPPAYKRYESQNKMKGDSDDKYKL